MANKERLQLWIENLLSGDYPQSTGCLYQIGHGYCCLGVLCETAINNGLDVEKEQFGETNIVRYECLSDIAPPAVMDWVGISNKDLIWDVLIEANDAKQQPFTEIAKIIERYMNQDNVCNKT